MVTPKLRFKEFDGEWTSLKIGNISDCIVPGRNKPKNFDGTIPWVTTPDLKDTVYVSDTLSGFYISETEAKSVGSKIVPTNSVVMSCVGDLGLFVINTKPIVINQQLHAFLLDSQKFNSLFVLNALSKNQNFIEKVATKTALPYLNKDNCNSIPLFITSLKEQTKIASFLSNVDEKIRQLTQKHELLNQYKQGMMQKLFSQQIRFKAEDGSEFGEWEETTLGKIVKIKNGYSPSKYDLKDKGSIPFLKVEELNNCIKFQKNSRFYTENAESDLILKNSIIFPKRGAAILNNKVRILSVDSLLDSNLMALIPSESIFYEYLYYVITFIELFKIADTSSIPQINNKHIEPYSIDLPCLEEQIKIANFLSAIDQKIEVVAQQIEQAKTWKKGLLQQMFI